jgi:hypothetical protein
MEMLINPCILGVIIVCLIGILLMIMNLPEKVEVGDINVIYFEWWLHPDDGWYQSNHASSGDFEQVQYLGKCSTGARYYKCVDFNGEIHFFKNKE